MKPPTPKSVKPGLVAEKVGRSVLKGARWGANVKDVMLPGILRWRLAQSGDVIKCEG